MLFTIKAWPWLCSLCLKAAPCCFYPRTQADGAYSVTGLLAEVIVFPICSLSFLPLSSHCSHYFVINLKNTRTEKYIKTLSPALAMSEALGGSPVSQVYSLSGIYCFRRMENIENIINFCFPITQLSYILVFYHIHFRFGGKEIVRDSV